MRAILRRPAVWAIASALTITSYFLYDDGADALCGLACADRPLWLVIVWWGLFLIMVVVATILAVLDIASADADSRFLD